MTTYQHELDAYEEYMLEGEPPLAGEILPNWVNVDPDDADTWPYDHTYVLATRRSAPQIEDAPMIIDQLTRDLPNQVTWWRPLWDHDLPPIKDEDDESN